MYVCNYVLYLYIIVSNIIESALLKSGCLFLSNKRTEALDILNRAKDSHLEETPVDDVAELFGTKESDEEVAAQNLSHITSKFITYIYIWSLCLISFDHVSMCSCRRKRQRETTRI
jgi:hypothetical protein